MGRLECSQLKRNLLFPQKQNKNDKSCDRSQQIPDRKKISNLQNKHPQFKGN